MTRLLLRCDVFAHVIFLPLRISASLPPREPASCPAAQKKMYPVMFPRCHRNCSSRCVSGTTLNLKPWWNFWNALWERRHRERFWLTGVQFGWSVSSDLAVDLPWSKQTSKWTLNERCQSWMQKRVYPLLWSKDNKHEQRPNKQQTSICR